MNAFSLKKPVESLGASTQGLELVDQKRRQKRWNKTAQIWCREAFTTRSTLNRFWAGKSIRRETFIAICKAVGVDWKDVVAQVCNYPATATSDFTPTEMMAASEMGWNESHIFNTQNRLCPTTLKQFKCMINPALIRDRAFDFAVRIINLCKVIDANHRVARSLSKKLIRSGTSIGANIEESQTAENIADLVHTLEMALKEARETKYWLRLLIASELIEESPLLPLLGETYELINLIATILIETKQSSQN